MICAPFNARHLRSGSETVSLITWPSAWDKVFSATQDHRGSAVVGYTFDTRGYRFSDVESGESKTKQADSRRN